MKREQFDGVILFGHKEAAVEVPFDPALRWSTPAGPLRPGRRGHAVRGSLNGVQFESCIVPRSKRFWLLVDDVLLKSARVSECDTARVMLEPSSTVKNAPRGSKKNSSIERGRSAKKLGAAKEIGSTKSVRSSSGSKRSR